MAACCPNLNPLMQEARSALEAEVTSLRRQLAEGRGSGGSGAESWSLREAELQGEIDGLRIQLQQRQGGGDAEEELDMLRSALEAAAERIKAAEEDKTAAEKSLGERLHSALDARDKAESALLAKGREEADLKRRVAELEGRLAVAEEDEGSAAASAAAAKEDADRLRSEAERLEAQLRSAVAESESRGRRTAQLEQQLREALQLQGMTPEEASKVQREAQERTKAAEALLAEAEARLRDAAARAEAADAREREAAEQAEEADQRVQQLARELEQVKSESEERRRRFQHLQTTVGSRESVLQERVHQLEAQLDAAAGQLAAATGRADALESQVQGRGARRACTRLSDCAHTQSRSHPAVITGPAFARLPAAGRRADDGL